MKSSPTSTASAASLGRFKIALLGSPVRPDVPWTDENVRKLRTLGFNTLQLNIAWGARPADEPLNLEDVVEVPAGREAGFAQPVPLRSDRSPERFQARREALRHRIRICQSTGMRSIFHFGAPYNAHQRYGDAPLNCLSDERTTTRYVKWIELFARQFPGVDDLLLYTYDQDAWLCDEFGPCPRCAGIPLHERVVPFVNRLAEAWKSARPAGRLWWEPWELSAGQSLQCIDLLDPERTGLALHSNIAEVMATLPVDRWLKLARHRARERNIPVVVEHFLGGATEEVEPFRHLTWPHALLRSLRAISALSPDGLKEYFGCDPTIDDPNLRLAGLFLTHPHLDDRQLLEKLAEPWEDAAGSMLEFWRIASEAMELFPWHTSWYIRKIGRCRIDHNMKAAFIRGQQAHTPSWESSRRSVFMKTDNLQPDPWMLEDVQLQCQLSAERLADALAMGRDMLTKNRLPADLEQGFRKTVEAWDEFRRRALSYGYHIRETNLTTVMRRQREAGHAIPARVIDELVATLKADQENQRSHEPCGRALRLLDEDMDAFLSSYFLLPDDEAPLSASLEAERDKQAWGDKGGFSVTSR
ncbi:hypothetical protein OpiT1DRAFT_02399 [Opitutaceae bacterium TAV1]|nr:hypothetical protein OpiT1DRAFT_02399 [Opitutaceae bacterium TAV1]